MLVSNKYNVSLLVSFLVCIFPGLYHQTTSFPGLYHQTTIFLACINQRQSSLFVSTNYNLSWFVSITNNLSWFVSTYYKFFLLVSTNYNLSLLVSTNYNISLLYQPTTTFPGLYQSLTRNKLTQASKNGHKPNLFPQKKFVSMFYAFNTIFFYLFERSLASMLMRYCCSMIGCFFGVLFCFASCFEMNVFYFTNLDKLFFLIIKHFPYK